MAQQTLNKSESIQETNFPNLSAGSYRLHVDLTANSNGTGAVTGQIDVTQTVGNAPVVVSSNATATPVSLRITPENIVLPLDAMQTMSVAGVGADGKLAFIGLSGLAWSSLGSSVGISAAGIAVANTAGSGLVSVKDGASGLTATATITVPSPPRSKWTVLVFMDAANDLQPYGLLNMNQMERLGGNADVRFVVQWKQYKPYFPDSTFDGTRRYLVTKDTSNDIKSTLLADLGTKIDMGNATTLRQFVDWGKSHYPADRTALVFWDHGSGWTQKSPLPRTRTINLDDQYGTSMNVQEIRQALSGQHLDLVAIDACTMQQIEVLNEFKDFADQVTASEELTPGPGYIYDKCFASFFSSPTADLGTLSAGIVNAQVNEPTYANQDITQSTVDTSKVAALNSAVDLLADSLIKNASSMTSTMNYVRTNARRFDPSRSFQFFYDLYDVCQKMRDSVDCPAEVKMAAANVQISVTAAVTNENHSNSMTNSHGISIDLSPARYYQPTKYGVLQFASQTRWGNWLAIAP